MWIRSSLAIQYSAGRDFTATGLEERTSQNESIYFYTGQTFQTLSTNMVEFHVV
jgi:hypothetical protein